MENVGKAMIAQLYLHLTSINKIKSSACKLSLRGLKIFT